MVLAMDSVYNVTSHMKMLLQKITSQFMKCRKQL